MGVFLLPSVPDGDELSEQHFVLRRRRYSVSLRRATFHFARVCQGQPKYTVDHLVYGVFLIPRANILHKQNFAREPKRSVSSKGRARLRPLDNIVDLCYNEKNKVLCIDQQGKKEIKFRE